MKKEINKIKEIKKEEKIIAFGRTKLSSIGGIQIRSKKLFSVFKVNAPLLYIAKEKNGKKEFNISE